jgi:hypothetical protein
VVSIAFKASQMQRFASSNWPMASWAFAKQDKYQGIRSKFHPVSREAVIPEVIMSIAGAPLPVSANKQP